MSGSVLEIEGLKTYFHTDEGVVKAVDDISLSIQEGQTLGVVGESGSGKSVTSLTIMRLLPDRAAQIAGGTVTLLGRDLLSISSQEMPSIRGSEIAMIFQEPMTSLNPVYRVGDQVAEAIIHHEGLKRREALQRTIELFEEVGIPDPHKRIRSYPHEMSGGQKQRVMIAMALSCNPKLLIADEPTTALDVTIQAQILDLMQELQQERGTAVMLITHDLAVVAETCQRVIVLYGGRIQEVARVEDLFDLPLHPYTQGLLASIPDRAIKGEPMRAIPGNVPSIFDFPEGCRFASRCPVAEARCHDTEPELVATAPGHEVRCHLVDPSDPRPPWRPSTEDQP